MEALGYPLSVLLTVIGIGLVITEALIPGGVFMILGATLLISGLLGMWVPVIGTPIGLIVTIPLVGATVYLAYSRLDIYGGDSSGVRGTSDSTSLKGERGRVTETVTSEDGEVKLVSGGMNPYYSARSEVGTIEEGTDVLVQDPRGGNVLVVAPVETSTAESE